MKRERVRAKIAPIERVLEYYRIYQMVEKLKEHELDHRLPVRKLKRQLLALEESLCELVGQDSARVFMVAPDLALLIFAHSYGAHDWREVRFVRLERLEL